MSDDDDDYTEAEVAIAVDEEGNYVVESGDNAAEAARILYESNATLCIKIVYLKVKIKKPIPVEVDVTVPDDDDTRQSGTVIIGPFGKSNLARPNADAPPQSYRMVGMTNSAPSLVPEGQRWVTVLVFV